MTDGTPSMLRTAFNVASKGFLMFGGVIPYIPQYMEISRTNDAEGFSLLVCLILLIANTTRIFFWFGRRYETVLLIQSIIICAAMFAMIEICVRVKYKNTIVPGKNRYFFDSNGKNEIKVHRFWDFDPKYFWNWTDFISYIEFMATYAVMVGFLTYAFLDNYYFVEGLGYAALLTEACLAVPQFLKNYSDKSTKGLSKKMVALWAMGDVYKTGYYIVNKSGPQFLVCGISQVIVDVLIAVQILFYEPRSRKYSFTIPTKKAQL